MPSLVLTFSKLQNIAYDCNKWKKIKFKKDDGNSPSPFSSHPLRETILPVQMPVISSCFCFQNYNR